MGFLNAAFLIGLIAGAVPVIIHLLNRRRVKRVKFSSLEFLEEVNRQRMRRINLRRILILLLRTLAVIMSVSLAGVAVWIGHFAWRVRAADVYPPPGSRHMNVRRVLRGAEAQRVATICFVLAVLLLAASCTLVPLVWELLERLGLAGR